MLSAPQVPRLYANGFNILMSNADVAILLLHNNAPEAALNLSYTTAKSLSKKLIEAITKLEEDSKQPIMTFDDIAEFLKDNVDDANVS